MKYLPEWKGRLKVSGQTVQWDGKTVGTVRPQYREGATSPGGMVTNTVFVTGTGQEYTSMTLAIQSFIPK